MKIKNKKLKISFDVWGTLIESNPEFKDVQSRKFEEMFNVSKDIFTSEIKSSKKYYDSFVEYHGLHIPREFIYHRAFPSLSLSDISEFIKVSDKLFREYPPYVKDGLDLELVHSLVRYQQVYVTSNTVMIYSNPLKYIVQDVAFVNTSNMIFSDMVGYSKPSKLIFRDDLDYHVGDNHITDGISDEYGIKFLDINNNEDIQILRELV